MAALTHMHIKWPSYGQESNSEQKKRMAIHLDNGDVWLQIDRYATELGWIVLPVPHFFSAKQIHHMVEQGGIDCVWCHQSCLILWQNLGFAVEQNASDAERNLYFLSKTNAVKSAELPIGTHKVTFTSGTTSEPKGVCLSQNHLLTVGKSLALATAHLGLTKHISLLPYSVLLENVAATYANHYAQLELVSLPLAEVGMIGSGKLDVTVMLHAIVKHQADSMIMMPQMLKQLVSYLIENPKDLSFIKFIAIGGAVCSEQLINSAHKLGLPVYQGYGISECGSVIHLNTQNNAAGSVGYSLVHCETSLTDDGEVLVKGPRFLGYLGQPDSSDNHGDDQQLFKTGDIGRYDEAGNLYIIGRKKNIIISSFGRNILPDWIEGELLAIAGIHQTAVYGEAQPFLSALCATTLSTAQLNDQVARLNETLPDYARIIKAVKVPPFTVANDQMTASGKLKHPQIFNHYKNLLETIYAPSIEATNSQTF